MLTNHKMSKINLLSDKLATRNRMHELMVQDNAHKSLVNAYKVKRELLKDQDFQQYYTIRTSDPVVIPPENKFSHCKGPRLPTIAPHHNLNITKSQTKAVRSGISAIHNKLSSEENYPSTYKRKYDESNHPISGDYIDDPRKATRLLQSTSSSKLTIPGRAADFKSEVQWRLLLRSDL